MAENKKSNQADAYMESMNKTEVIEMDAPKA